MHGNYTVLQKDNEEASICGQTSRAHGLGDLTLPDGTTPQRGLTFDAITTQGLKTFIVEIDKYILNSKWNFKGPRIVKIILTKMKLEDSTFGFKIYCKNTAREKMLFWHKTEV